MKNQFFLALFLFFIPLSAMEGQWVKSGNKHGHDEKQQILAKRIKGGFKALKQVAEIDSATFNRLPSSTKIEILGMMPKAQSLLNKILECELQYAVKEGDTEKVFDLLDKKIDPNCKDNNSETPLYLAAKYGHYGVCEKLIKLNAEINAVDKQLETPLCAAARAGNSKIVELLLSNGAAIEGNREEGCPPLYCAAREGHLAVVKILVEAGAQIDTGAADAEIPIAAALIECHYDVFDFLSKHSQARDAALEVALEKAAENGDVSDFNHLVKHYGADPETSYENITCKQKLELVIAERETSDSLESGAEA